MRKYFWSIFGVLAVCTLLQAQDKSSAKVSIKGETWKDKGFYDPERDGPPPGFFPLVVKDGPAFEADEKNGRVLFWHGQVLDLDKAEALKLPVRAVTCIGLASDYKTLFVASASDWSIWAFPLGRDGMPKKGRRALDLTMPAQTQRLPVTALTTDNAGRVYAATSQGVQVFDSKGKIIEILSAPANGKIYGLRWSGTKHDELVVYGEWSGGSSSLFALKLNAVGMEQMSFSSGDKK